MSRTYTDIKTGKYIDINISGNEFLGKITLGLWEKLGFAPRTKEDCRLVSRICKNYIKYQEYINDSPFLQELYNIEKLPKEDIEWLKEVQKFFENANGIEY